MTRQRSDKAAAADPVAPTTSVPGREDRSAPTAGAEAPAGVSRRAVITRALGLAAAGAAGGSILSEMIADPAGAATTTEPGGVAPSVVSLVDAPTIAVDASLGNDFRVILQGDRAMGNPTNPADGQKIVFQVTQGVNAPSTVIWGSGYAFADSLPAPTLSTTAGKTDLAAFVYNSDKGQWLHAAFIRGFAAANVTLPPGHYRLFPTTNGPASAVAYTGPFLAGVLFQVSAAGTWFEGYWWWVCPTGQATAPQKFALWQVYGTGAGSLVANATASSGPLVAGQWNFVPLATPVALTPGVTYVASTGLSNGFPNTNNQFGSGEPYAAGIVSGPLSAYSDTSGLSPNPFGVSQGLFGTAGTDPTVTMPVNGYASANFWMDLQVGTTAPTGSSYRLFPSLPAVPGMVSSDTSGYTVATEFRLSKACALNRIWFYSPAGATALPTRCAIWDVGSQSTVSGTDQTAPAWSGPAGSGWVSCTYTGVTLPAGDYKVAVFSAGGSRWYQGTPNYWGTGGVAANGITTGPLTAPGTASASGPGQCTFNFGSWAYPLTYATAANGENNWIDVEVTPS